MTGYARQLDEAGGARWVWELRGVNGRGLDVKCRLAAGFESLEPALRKRISTRFKRGNLNISLSVNQSHSVQSVTVNHRLLNQMAGEWRKLRLRNRQFMAAAPNFMALRGVVEPQQSNVGVELEANLAAGLLASLDRVIEECAQARLAEGARLQQIVQNNLAGLQKLVTEARGQAAERPVSHNTRLKEQLSALLEDASTLTEERLAVEIALLASKTDVTEELDRLQAHCEAAHDLLDKGGIIGRKLDFLTQEFNREANTLCAKSNDLALTQTGLALKNVIDQLREQAQNIE